MNICKNCAWYVYKNCMDEYRGKSINCPAWSSVSSFRQIIEVERQIAEAMNHRRAAQRLPPMEPDKEYPIDEDIWSRVTIRRSDEE